MSTTSVELNFLSVSCIILSRSYSKRLTSLAVKTSFFPFFLLKPFTFVPQAPKSLPSDSCQSVLCIYESVSILFVSLFYVH